MIRTSLLSLTLMFFCTSASLLFLHELPEAQAQQNEVNKVSGEHHFMESRSPYPKLILQRLTLPSDPPGSKAQLSYPENMTRRYVLSFCASPQAECEILGQAPHSLFELGTFKYQSDWTHVIYSMAQDLELRRASEDWLADDVDLFHLKSRIVKRLKRARSLSRFIRSDALSRLN